MKKTWTLLVISLISLALFTACASNADTLPSPSPTVSVSPSATPQPSPTASPMASPEAGLGANTVEDALRVSDNVTEEAAKLSELDTAEAVVAGNIALVGVTYDAQYQGGLTERLVEMVKTRVEAVDKTLTTVHVTDDEELTAQIAQLREKLQAGDISFEELQTQVLKIGSTIAGGSDPTVNEPQNGANT